MQGNRKADTRPEVAIRSALHRRGFRYYKNKRFEVNGVAVRPDIVFPRKKVAVFVDGCFWHRCPKHGNSPSGPNAAYWQQKLDRNVERDKAITAALDRAGWKVVRVWEHESMQAAMAAVAFALEAEVAQ